MSRERNSPSAVILDMLRSARSRQRSAQSLIAAGALFGFSENTVRVTLSRLASRGLVGSPERGLYRLSEQTDALNDFVERWRLGEARTRAWRRGAWLFAHLAPGGTEQAATLWALDALGFREVRPGLFARPDNLALTTAELRALAESIGLGADVLLVAGAPEGDPSPASWWRAWQPEILEADYGDALDRLQDSAARLARLPAEEARLECFTLGGEMIHRLAKDPLLPDDCVDTKAREALWRAMLAYDVQGKEIWARDSATGTSEALRRMPRPQLATTS